MQTNDFDKQKNLLDLEHQTYLNYFNILAISGITTIFTIVWSLLTEKVSVSIALGGLAIAAASFLVLLYAVLGRIKATKEKIQGL